MVTRNYTTSGTTANYGWCKKCFTYHLLDQECPCPPDWWAWYTKPANFTWNGNTVKKSSDWVVLLERKVTSEVNFNGEANKESIECKSLWNEVESVVKLIVTSKSVKDITAECVENKSEAIKLSSDYFDAAIEDWLFISD